MGSTTPTGIVLDTDDARVIEGEVGGRHRVVVPTEATDGRVEAFEQVIQPGHGPPLHVHDHQDETFVVLAGRVRFVIGDQDAIVGPGASAVAPRGIAHAFQVLGEQPARLLVTFTPAGIEPFFRDASQLDRADADRDTIARLAAPCGMRVLGPAPDAGDG